MYGMDHGSWMLGGGLLMLLWWLLPIALVMALAVYLSRRSKRSTTSNEALDILMERYARGEIGSEEFGQKKHDLGGQG